MTIRCMVASASLWVALAGCHRSTPGVESEGKGGRRTVPEQGRSPASDTKPKLSVVTLRPVALSVVQSEPVDVEWSRRTPLGGRQLVEADRARVGLTRMLTSDRVLVGVGSDSPRPETPIEFRVVDVVSGDSILTLIDAGWVFPKLGLGVGLVDVDGADWLTLYRSDGMSTPLWRASDDHRAVVVHPAYPRAWVFADEGEESTLMAPWIDLSEPPPSPNQPLPGRVAWHTGAVRPPGRLGPSLDDPAGTPLFVDIDDADACEKVELTATGFTCTAAREYALSEGWRFAFNGESEAYEAFRPEPPQVQRLDLPEECEIYDVSLDPPRVYLDCADSGKWFLWSEGRLWEGPKEPSRAHAVVDDANGKLLDLSFLGDARIARPRAGQTWRAVIARAKDGDHVFALEVATGELIRADTAGASCSPDVASVERNWLALTCAGSASSAQWHRVFDLEARRFWDFPRVVDLLPQP